MLHYPGTMQELIDRYSKEESCREYLEKIRWPDGFRCPRCQSEKSWLTEAGLKKCSRCTYRASLFVGTIFQGSKIPLRIWFQAIWWFTNQKSGVSALGLQRTLGLGSYRTAWTLLHKMRLAMVRPGRDKLSGEVEVDETFVGGHEKGKYGRAYETKQLVAIAAEIDGEKTGRIRMAPISNVTASTLHSFIMAHIEPGSTIVTDGLNSYPGIKQKGYDHKPLRPPYVWENRPDADEWLPRVHRVASLLKRWYYGTYHGRIEHKYFGTYLNEFTFRFNRRTSRSRGLLFYRLLENSVKVEPTPYRSIRG